MKLGDSSSLFSSSSEKLHFIKVSETRFEILLWSRSKDSLLVMLASEAVTMEVSSVSNNLTCKLLRFLTIVVLPGIR